jgi:hypothetical protein
MEQVENKKNTSTKTENTTNTQSGKWYSEDDLNNEIIRAYKNFKKSLQEDIKKGFSINMNLAKEISEKIYKALNAEKEIRCRKIHLKPNSVISFEAIVILPEKAFLSDSFKKAYEIAFDICHEYQKDSFNFDFNFMPSSRHVNSKALVADGYYLSYQ